MHFAFVLRLRRGDGVQARRQRAQQADQLFGAQIRRRLTHHVDDRRVVRIALQRGFIRQQADQRFVARQRGVFIDDRRGVLRQFEMAAQRLRQRQGLPFHLDRLVAFQPQQLHQFVHQRRIVVEPYAERIARLIAQAGVAQIDLDMAHVFIRRAAGNFLIDRQLGGERLFLAVRAAVDQIDRAAGQHARRGAFRRRARLQHRYHLFTPGGGQFWYSTSASTRSTGRSAPSSASLPSKSLPDWQKFS